MKSKIKKLITIVLATSMLLGMTLTANAAQMCGHGVYNEKYDSTYHRLYCSIGCGFNELRVHKFIAGGICLVCRYVK